ncbi:protein-L-isoaspartate(D-aspartate) O-methyltransferase [Amycolatopsis mediterranei S699]|uniref:Protein-L-isoaspartate O-methyltransferase n=2 Tax=Amycolatopsis mediterranei TaxID=33910 RepID=A0A0H3DEK4_AMYMU|nr:methyltransferase domain-containing protein [Amycolatopsis mediterranei]ADJ48513.1 protein-L-isoaspartate(D-aspartate) O-methyltransferase [Amycolatopsis mediterranei U32]AEK45440.1 protein-L-isoaspartate(D-aspartate) O-methyltransferase [Amycolatopsis mediterranei S699]AFO80222.1 protein-L-isoaspartate(D-aspartate) O-methyltransferase [Amycolatopsis mediterranei S699]AGT87350.1 protein-L-isoaspartate(D-aspartate) O-methyltransferase [Amycolatopsis mediterranei RB]KDO11040.1 protein-L-isoas
MIDLESQLQRLAADLNHALVQQLVDQGVLSTPAWRAAFEALPRHLFAPKFTLPDNLGGQSHDAADSAQREEWLRAVYQDEALLTDFDEQGILVSSCSAPAVVATMLEQSGATDGDSVLEIGTGTGWTAALLSHRLGSESVTSVDVNPAYVDRARDRLDALDLAPTLAIADGYLGYPERAPYDRIIATASLRQVPPAWLTQVRPGGTILTDIRGAYAGNLARLTVDVDQSAHGQFLPTRANFMPLRSPDQPFLLQPELSRRAVRGAGETRMTRLAPTVLRERGRVFAFFAQLAMPGTESGHVKVTDGPVYFCLTDPHTGAWARVEATPGNPAADRQVTQGGDRRLWDELEAAHELWLQLGQPRREDFTISVTPDAEQVVAHPKTDKRWSLPL